MRFQLAFLCLLAFLSGLNADVYMHWPRGSNNRLNEANAERNNGNRLFNSQNNARGGYNVGDKTNTAAGQVDLTKARDPDNALNPSTTEAVQYQKVYYEGSIHPIEWTAQHGCGGHEGDDPHKANCNIVIQYACETQHGDPSVSTDDLRDGSTTNTPTEETNIQNNEVTVNPTGTRYQSNVDQKTGRHETEAYYFECYFRKRNYRLFLADQNLNNGDTARFTRQNSNGNRNGLECPEERDYYPYWSPSPWRDAAYITDHPEQFCNADGTFKGVSQNTAKLYKCVDTAVTTAAANYPPSETQKILYAITEQDCIANPGAEWRGFSWKIPAPRCYDGRDFRSRDNELGNGKDTQPVQLNWTIPSFAELTTAGENTPATKVFTDNAGIRYVKCVLRLRYNISTDDYDPWKTDYLSNQNTQTGTYSPVTQDPYIDIGAVIQNVRLNVNTNQFGRTFQDRSHTFWVKELTNIPVSPATGGKIYNLGVRGKRGNVVQTFPAVEYDFQPSRIHISKADLLHIQWTGSNTHNNGGGGGDGQAGDAGEGTNGSDRHNIVQIGQSPSCGTGHDWCGDFSVNFPLPLDKFTDNMWSRSKCYHTYTNTAIGSSWKDCAIYFASGGYYKSIAEAKTYLNDANSAQVDSLFNNGFASLPSGALVTFGENYADGVGVVDKTYSFDYMCSRNNNFSNRAQKATIVVVV